MKPTTWIACEGAHLYRRTLQREPNGWYGIYYDQHAIIYMKGKREAIDWLKRHNFTLEK